MKVEIRIYKLFDTDIVALVDNGYPVCEMMREAVIGYANGKPVSYQLDEHLFFDANNKKNVRLRFTIPESDRKTIQLVRNIKHGYRNSFCKMVLRDALLNQNVGCYFSKEDMLNLQEENVNAERIVTPISALRKKKGQKTVTEEVAAKQAMHKTDKVETETDLPVPKTAKPAEKHQNKKPSNPNDILAAFEAL